MFKSTTGRGDFEWFDMQFLDFEKVLSMTFCLDNGILFSIKIAPNLVYDHEFWLLKRKSKTWTCTTFKRSFAKSLKQYPNIATKMCKPYLLRSLQCTTCLTRAFARSSQPKQHLITWLREERCSKNAIYRDHLQA